LCKAYVLGSIPHCSKQEYLFASFFTLFFSFSLFHLVALYFCT
jgi:hypothetical protein